ncbi:Coenzyme F420 hydrogenase/dehydrogenase, beta subunit C-terminal domain [Roseibium sp.]|uniref:Coenzyme F420 hydrogenase/dehydrogenase, beta subunit C-terminal domain n=1 Tax=Roseibium sp. TaxID=1936156 RepID=UPI003BADAAE7
MDAKTEMAWGAITGIWEGYASDNETRYKASSGGALTAIAQYCLEVLEMPGVLHSGENRDDPIRNKTRLSRSREDLLEVLGSRYSPASVCDGLDLVEQASGPCVVIGKPVEIAATRNAMTLRPALEKNVGVTLSFFCAETPPTKATRSLLEKLGVVADTLTSLRYRGHGWPGYFVTQNASEEPKQHWIYDKTWAYLQQYRPWAVHQWPDGSGELADISCGDPWYEEPDGENPGFSLVVARTKLGKEIIEGAIEHGYLTASSAEVWKLEKSQAGLLRKKAAVWGRRQMHRVLCMPIANFKDLDLFTLWLDLPFRTKVRSTLGTMQRILRRRLWKLP